MKWVEILGFLAGFIANGYFYELLTKIDYQVFLGLYLPKNEPIYKIISIFISFIINIICGVNIYDLQKCLRIFGVI